MCFKYLNNKWEQSNRYKEIKSNGKTNFFEIFLANLYGILCCTNVRPDCNSSRYPKILKRLKCGYGKKWKT